MKTALNCMAVFFCGLLLAGPRAEEKEEKRTARIVLPVPSGLEMPLGEALRGRRSIRKFDPGRDLTMGQLGALLWAMAGITRPDPAHPAGGRRAAPSAYEAYAIDVVVTSAAGTFTYLPREHALEPHPTAAGKDLRAEVPRTDWVKEAPLLVMLISDPSRYPERVRPERRRDYVHADAAVMGENLYLAAAALGLGTVLTADARPDAGALLGLGEERRIVFILPVGSAAAE